jgi:hypothetical protein
MEDAYIFCNVIKIPWQRKITKTEIWGPFGPLKLQKALAQMCKKK